MTVTYEFQRAVKSQERLRMALDGPAGGGKTWTALLIATYLVAKDGGRIAVIDSERGSARKYASDFDFDHLALPDNDPRSYIGAIRAAEAAGYTVVIVDSLSHAWEGTLDLKDKVTARSANKDSFGAWRQVTPVHNELVDTMLRLPAHLIVTMRTKTEYLVDPTNADPSKRVQRVGLKPVQRDGVEYEFDVVGDLDIENTMVITKTRCSAVSGLVVRKPGDALAKVLHDWLNDGEPLAPRTDIEALRARVAALPDAVTRTECARSFKARFGPVEFLTLANLADARAHVATFETPVVDVDPDPQPDPEPDRAPIPEAPADDEPVAAATNGNGHSSRIAGVTISGKLASKLHADVANLAKALGHTKAGTAKAGTTVADNHWSEGTLGALVLSATNTRTDDPGELTMEEKGTVERYIAELAAGNMGSNVADSGNVTLVIDGQTYRFVRTPNDGLVHVGAVAS